MKKWLFSNTAIRVLGVLVTAIGAYLGGVFLLALLSMLVCQPSHSLSVWLGFVFFIMIGIGGYLMYVGFGMYRLNRAGAENVLFSYLTIGGMLFYGVLGHLLPSVVNLTLLIILAVTYLVIKRS